MVQSFKDLKVWQKARLLTKDVYIATKDFPVEERYGLTSQIRRATISIPSNIAEGSSKRSTREFLRFLNISYGSLAELEAQLILANDLNFLSEKQLVDITANIEEIGRMVNGLIRSLEEKTELRTLNSGL